MCGALWQFEQNVHITSFHIAIDRTLPSATMRSMEASERIDTLTDAELIAEVREEGSRYDENHPARVEAFVERYGEQALPLYAILDDMIGQAHLDCIQPEAQVAKDGVPGCVAIPEPVYERIERVLGLKELPTKLTPINS